MIKLRILAFWLMVAGLVFGCNSAQDEAVPPILYLSWDENGRVQLYRIEKDDELIQLTESDQDILDFAPSPDGSQIVYSTGNGMWLMDGNGRSSQQILTCAPSQCNQIVWHSDSRRLLYERTAAPDASPQLWWLDSATGQTVPLNEDDISPSQAARFSANGEWVSYVISPDQGIGFYNFSNGRYFQIPSNLGTPAIWHPTEPTFLYRNQQIIIYHGDEGDDHTAHSHEHVVSLPLLLGDTANEGLMPAIISEAEITDDDSPAWSPDGAWIVFGRKLPGVENGRQLWLIRPDGSEAKALTDDPLVHHGVPSWSGDGRFILFQRFDTQDSSARPGIWLLEPDTGKMVEIAAAGFNPQWLP
jgi:TolB protein